MSRYMIDQTISFLLISDRWEKMGEKAEVAEEEAGL